LSLDEMREAFLPTLWEPKQDGDRVKQVWFSGAHSEVGGGEKDSTLADISLAWMIAECHQTKMLSFVDIEDPVDHSLSYLLNKAPAGRNSAEGEANDSRWNTSRYPKQSQPLGIMARLSESATGFFWWLTNLGLPFPSGIRQPNKAALKPDETNERIHQSIKDRQASWPCAPIKRNIPGTIDWELSKGGKLQETVPDDTEKKFKGKIRPVA
jgi:Uncharacterized alpha/beta hydrolase domain (DUF2235)